MKTTVKLSVALLAFVCTGLFLYSGGMTGLYSDESADNQLILDQLEQDISDLEESLTRLSAKVHTLREQ